MNGRIKFRKPNGPAFEKGQVWVSSSGLRVKIVSIRVYPGADISNLYISDYAVTYEWTEYDGTVRQHEKDAWNFQVRYTHQSDLI